MRRGLPILLVVLFIQILLETPFIQINGVTISYNTPSTVFLTSNSSVFFEQDYDVLTLTSGSIGGDAYIDGANPNTNYGSSAALSVGYSTSSSKYMMALFHLASSTTLKPIYGYTSTQFCFYIYYYSGGSAPDIYAGSITSSWQESTVTWNTIPSYSSGSSLGASSAVRWVCITNPNLIVPSLQGIRHGVILYTTYTQSSYYYSIYSKEAASNKPYISGIYYYATLSSMSIKTYNRTAYIISFKMNRIPSTLASYARVRFNITDPAGNLIVRKANATYDSSTLSYKIIVNLNVPSFKIVDLRLVYAPPSNPSGVVYYSYGYTFIVTTVRQVSIINPTPGSIFYTNIVNFTLSIPPFSSANLSVIFGNGTKMNITIPQQDVGIIIKTMKLAEGRNVFRLVAVLLETGREEYSNYVDVVVDQYLPNPPSIVSPSDRSNITYNVLNLSWNHDGFDVEKFIMKAWRSYPYYWSTSQQVPGTVRWNYLGLPGSGSYYIQVVAVDAAGNERPSVPILVNIASSDVVIDNITLNMTGFSLKFTNKVNGSRDAFWNITLKRIEGSLVEYRQGALSFYPNETKTFSMTWQRNLTPNVYLASVWVRDSFGKQTGYLTSFIAIPPIQQVSGTPISAVPGPWESDVVDLNSSVTLRSIYVLTNANPKETLAQVFALPLPNVTLRSIQIRNRITGAEYQATLGPRTVNITVPSIPPYSSLILEVKGTTEGVVNGYLNASAAQPVFIGNSYWKPHNLTIVNPLSMDVTVRLVENATLKFECPKCSISGNFLALKIPSNGREYVKAYKYFPQNVTQDLMRPLSSVLDFMSTTTTGVFMAMVIGLLLPTAAIARWRTRRW